MTVVKTFGIATLLLGIATIAETVEGAPIRNGLGNGWRWRIYTASRAQAAVEPAPTAPAGPTQIVTNAGIDNWEISGRYATLGAKVRETPTIIPRDRFFSPTAIEPEPIEFSPVRNAADSLLSPRYDALVNLGDGPNYEASFLLSGSPRPWYESPVVERVFGGTPDAAERAKFTEDVLRTVQGVFQRSGVSVSLTSDPSANVAHTLSVVSNAFYAKGGETIGVTDVGRDGFTLIDKLDDAEFVDDLATAVGNNVAHELMHAFGVEEHADDTGEHLDSGMTSWEVLTDPNARFSDEAARLLLAKNFRFSSDEWTRFRYATQNVAPQPVPEPSTILAWTAVGLGVLGYRNRERLRGTA